MPTVMRNTLKRLRRPRAHGAQAIDQAVYLVWTPDSLGMGGRGRPCGCAMLR